MARPATLTSPVASDARPASARKTSIAPEPTWPARQITMPRCAIRLKFCTTGGTHTFLTTSIGSPALLSQRGYISPMLRPSIICISCARSISAVRRVPTSSPLRNTETVSQIWNTSPSRCVM